MKNRDFVFTAAVAGCMLFAAGCATETVTSRTSIPPANETPGIVDNGAYNRLAPQFYDKQTVAPLPQAAATADVARKEAKKYPRLVMDGVAPAPKKVQSHVAGGETYTVVSGDTLGHIALRHKIRVAELAAVNGLDLKTAVIRPGQKLVLPKGVKAVAGKPAPARSSSASSGAVVAAGGTYVVVSGDYPERIAKRHGVSTKALLQANNLTEKSVLQIGQKLVIPGKNAPAAAPAAAPAVETAAPAAAPVVDSAAVVEPAPAAGESQIDFGVAAVVEETASTVAADPFSYTGKTVTIIERTQSLQDFAAAVGVDAEVVRSLNPGLIGADDMIEENTVIAIPVY